MTSALDDDRLAKIEERRAITRRELATLSNDAPAQFAPTAAAILLAEKDVPDLAAEVKRLRDDLAEMTRCRDAAVRLAEREDTAIEFHLEDRLRDGLVGMASWPGPVPDHPPDWLILAVARIVRPELARLTAELAKYIGWEPTVREEYEHACGQVDAVTEVVRGFKRDHGEYVNDPGRDDTVTEFVIALEKALEIR